MDNPTELETSIVNASHDLKNALGAIRMAIFNIKRKSKDVSVIEPHIATIEKKVVEANETIINLRAKVK